ncbi:WG repeat-containing protein [Sediminibacterium sp.]|uniref:WG repeat-containing protein n=1 Tax=Sediminibacterium sp. TaxID=1917865 RepID=UPI003F711BD4
MRLLVFVFVLITFPLTHLYAQAITVVNTSFDDDRFNYGSKTTLSKNDSLLYFLENGSFQINNKHFKGSPTRWVTLAFGMNSKAYTKYKADIMQIAGVQDYGFGIVLSAKDGKNFIQFGIAANGYYTISSAIDGKLNSISNGWVKSSLIKTGFNNINQLAVEKKGEEFQFILNEVTVKQIRLNAQPFIGNMGLYATGNMHVAMDKIEIQQWLQNNSIEGKIEAGYNPRADYPIAEKPIATKSKQPEVFGIMRGQYGFDYGLIDKDGYRIVDPILKYASINEQVVTITSQTTLSSGVYDLQLNNIIPPIMQTINVSKDKSNLYFSARAENGYWGLIDQTGKTILPFVYNYLDRVSEGLVYAKNSKGWGVIDFNGLPIIPFGTIDDEDEIKKRTYRYPMLFKKGRLIVKAHKNDGGKFGVMDNSGKWAIPPKYQSISFIDTNQAYKVSIVDPKDKSTKYGVLDYNGKEIIPLKYSTIELEGKNYAVAEGNISVGFDLDDLADDELMAALDEEETNSRKWGMLSHTGAIIIPVKHSYIASTADKQMVLVEDEKIKTLYDHTGKAWLSLSVFDEYKYDSLLFKGKPKGDYRTSYPYYSQGLINVSKAGKWGFVDKTGKAVIPFQYEHASAFYNGFALVKKGTEWWHINKQGKKVSSEEANPKTGIDFSNKVLPPIRLNK